MVNSIGPMGMMYGMYGANRLCGMYGNGGNVHQAFKSQYGVGYPDSGASRPFIQPYPMAIIPYAKESPVKKSWFGRVMSKLFS